MRMASSIVLPALVALAIASPAVAREWNVRAGMGAVMFSGESAPRGGSSVFVGADTPVAPWLLAGAEASSREFTRGPGVSYPEVRIFQDRSYDISLAATVRVQPPVRRGLVPFALGEAGLGRTQWGDLHVQDLGFGFPGGVTPGVAKWGVRSTLGVGLRGALARPLPDFEVSVRRGWLSGERDYGIVEPRVAVAW